MERAIQNGEKKYRSPFGLQRPQGGFAYLLLLISIAVLSIAATASIQIGAQISRRAAEQQLLTIGLEFTKALRSYAGVAFEGPDPVGIVGPKTLENLIRDPRSAGIRRHLRQLYFDPLTGNANWGIERDSSGNILSIYSLAEGQPIKQSGFEPVLLGFDNAKNYQTWRFGFSSRAAKSLASTTFATDNQAVVRAD